MLIDRITTNLEFSRWGPVPADDHMAAATVDRIIRYGHLLVFDGPMRRTWEWPMRVVARKRELGRPCQRREVSLPRLKVDVAIHADKHLTQTSREVLPADHGLVFHDDQGCRHASRAFRRAPGSHGITQPVSRPGRPCDDAVAESFLEAPGRELIKDGACEGREEARQETSKYVEPCHDAVRQHSRPGYAGPTEYERENEATPLTNCPV